MIEHVSADWVLNQLAGMAFPERGGAYDYIRRALRAQTDGRPPGPGDTVKLRSGGPVMTIDAEYERENGNVTRWRCVWFDADGACSGEYAPLALCRADPPAAPSAPNSEPDAWWTFWRRPLRKVAP